jgi:sulfatase maturation enzyme AslB (radical SAM superfamily)
MLEALDLVLTAECNLRCDYCYQKSRRGGRMTWRTARAALDTLLASPAKHRAVTFLGGEPLLALDIMRRVAAYLERRTKDGRRITLSVSTNGTLLDTDVAMFLAEHRVATQVSLDGVADAQRVRGRGTFPVVRAALERLASQCPGFFTDCVSVAVVVSGATLTHLTASVRLLLRLGVADIQLGPLLTHDPTWDGGATAELAAQMASIHALCLAHYRRTGSVPLHLFRRHNEADGPRPDGDVMCRVGQGARLTVDTDGEVVGCPSFATSYQELPPLLAAELSPLRLGHIGDPGLADRVAAFGEAVARSRLFSAKSSKGSSLGHCGTCQYLATCVACPVSVGHTPGNEDPNRIPDNICAFNQVVWGWRQRFPIQPSLVDELLGRAEEPPLLRRIRAAAGAPG